MQYQAELSFFESMLTNFHIPFQHLIYPFDSITDFDQGLRRLLNPDTDYKAMLNALTHASVSNVIYRIYDELHCHYFFFEVPDREARSFMLIGPYLLNTVTSTELLDSADRFSIAPEFLSQLEKFYQNLPLLQDENILLTLVLTLGERMWGNIDSFSIKDVYNSVMTDIVPVTAFSDSHEPDEPVLSMKMIEERYAAENQLIQAIAQGQVHKAELYINHFNSRAMEQRVADPVRNIKNYTIIMNTLLRKAAEYGAVHPLHIDSLSSRFARKIELVTSEEGAMQLQKEMIHKYCLLVKNHSLKGYSLLVRKVLTQIDSDLTADLSLKTLAKLLNVNPSYLSTLFKKETGSTLTEFVNHKRIEHAIFLLNSTSMQIQTIAQFCGVPDVNYFTKTFKKVIGKTPKEYRDSISPYK